MSSAILRPALALFALTALAAAAPADAEPTARELAHSHITGATLRPGTWYTPASHELMLQLTGTGAAKCGAQAVFSRHEDAAQATVSLGPLNLPVTVGSAFPGPFGLPPGTYSIVVNGVDLTSQGAPACTGSVALGPIKVDETIVGQNYPKITGAKWEGATANGGVEGLYAVSGPDKILDVNIVNYLDGSHWTKSSPTTLGAVCALTVNINFNGVPMPDPYALALSVNYTDNSTNPPTTKTGTPIYRGQIITPGAGGATYKVNVTKIIKAMIDNHSISKGQTATVTVESTSWNRGEIAPCIGKTATMTLKGI